MRPSGDETDSYDEEGEYSAVSDDYSENEEEERAYLSAIERDSELMRQMQPSNRSRELGSRSFNSPSLSSAKSPTVTPQQVRQTSQPQRVLSPSSDQQPRRSSQPMHSPVLSTTTSATQRGTSGRKFFAPPESFHSLSHQASRESLSKVDNPWAQQEPVKYQRVQQYRQQMSEEDASSSRAGAETPISHIRLPPSDYPPSATRKLTSPVPAQLSSQRLPGNQKRHQSTAASDMASNPPEPGRAMRSPTSEHIPPSVVALGPATKRALENLQHEIVALNNRIDGLKEELVERNTARQRRVSNQAASDSGSSDDGWETWRWVLKAAIRHAFINILVAALFFFVMYKRKSPIAFAIISRVRTTFFPSMRRL
ncbi:hypothetical protein NQZ79_g2095 [Umbelopsis isabellina]|nr:hypothetical protein NQZ79_g2095 [Umbelopsis isabellina]